MTLGMGYADAVKVLGGSSRAVTVLDGLVGGLMLTASGTGVSWVLNLFDAKGEFSRLSQDLVTTGLVRARGLNRYSRGQRLEAAHGIVVVSSYFHTLSTASQPV